MSNSQKAKKKKGVILLDDIDPITGQVSNWKNRNKDDETSEHSSIFNSDKSEPQTEKKVENVYVAPLRRLTAISTNKYVKRR